MRDTTPTSAVAVKQLSTVQLLSFQSMPFLRRVATLGAITLNNSSPV